MDGDLREFRSYAQMQAVHCAELAKFLGHDADMQAMAKGMANNLGIALSDLLGPSHKRFLAEARFPIWAHLHKQGYSLTQIGRYFGGRHHTTILHGIRRAEEIKEREERLK